MLPLQTRKTKDSPLLSITGSDAYLKFFVASHLFLLGYLIHTFTSQMRPKGQAGCSEAKMAQDTCVSTAECSPTCPAKFKTINHH